MGIGCLISVLISNDSRTGTPTRDQNGRSQHVQNKHLLVKSNISMAIWLCVMEYVNRCRHDRHFDTDANIFSFPARFQRASTLTATYGPARVQPSNHHEIASRIQLENCSVSH